MFIGTVKACNVCHKIKHNCLPLIDIDNVNYDDISSDDMFRLLQWLLSPGQCPNCDYYTLDIDCYLFVPSQESDLLYGFMRGRSLPNGYEDIIVMSVPYACKGNWLLLDKRWTSYTSIISNDIVKSLFDIIQNACSNGCPDDSEAVYAAKRLIDIANGKSV